jgi:hypothetical protein
VRKLPAITLSFVLASAGIAVTAKSALFATNTVEAAHAATISVDQIYKSVDVAALPQHPGYDAF